LNDIVDNISHIIDYYKTHLHKEKIQLHITGGEPTMWDDFGEFTRHFKINYNCIISMSTNGSRSLGWWKKYGHYIDHVILSCHNEKVNPIHTKRVADMLYDKHVWVNAIVLMDPRRWDKCLDIISQLKTSKRRWSIVTTEVFHETVSYTEEQIKFIGKPNKRLPNLWYYLRYMKTIYKEATIFFNNGKRKKVPHNWITLHKLNQFFGWNCNIGVDTFFINKHGDMQGACGEKLYNLDYKYNIYDPKFKQKFKPKLTSTTCQQTICHCIPEVNTTKQKINNKRVIPIISI
jgi:organic radical activating enzyme